MSKGQRALLPPEEEERLQQLGATGTDTIRQRAQAILAWHDGITAAETARRTKLSENQVRYLWRQYQAKGLDLFMVEAEPVVIPATTAVPLPPPEPEVPGAVSLHSLLESHHVDMAHAEYVSTLAVKLFDATVNMHRLPETARPLLEAAALLHNIGYESDPANHNTKGRDLILAQSIKGFTDDEHKILACTTAFHRKKVKPETEPAYLELSDELQQDALALSALLRVADGLDASQTQSTTIDYIEMTPETVLVMVEGECARADAEQAQKKADLWHQVFSTPIKLSAPPVATPDAPVHPLRILPEPSPRLDTTFTIAKASRAFVLQTLERIEALLKLLQVGDTSVLVSLVREVNRLAEAAMLAEARDFRKEIRWLNDTIEKARFTTAMSERLSGQVDESDAELMAAATAKMTEWNLQTETQIKALDMRRFNKLAADLRLALIEDVDPNEKALLSFQVGPILWGHLTALRGIMEYGTSVEDALEGTRRLQDHLIAFRRLLGGEVGQVLDMLAPLESYLTAIQVSQAITTYLEPKPIKKGRKTILPTPDPAVDLLRQSQTETLEMLADDLPAVWSAVNSIVFRRAFALAIASA